MAAILALSLAACGGASPTTAPPIATAANTPSPQPEPTAATTPATTSADLAPVGTWRVELNAAELVAAGWPADVTPPGSYTWTFEDGRATIDLKADDGSAAHCDADLAILDGSTFRLDYDDGDCGREVDTLSWSLDDDGPHLKLVSTNAPLDQQKAYLETEVWRLQPAAAWR